MLSPSRLATGPGRRCSSSPSASSSTSGRVASGRPVMSVEKKVVSTGGPPMRVGAGCGVPSIESAAIAGGGEGGGESGGVGRAAHLHGLRGQVGLEGLHAGDVADPGADRPYVPRGSASPARGPRSRRLLVRVGRCPPCRGALSVRCPSADHRDPAAGARVRCAGVAARPRIGGPRRDDPSREGGPCRSASSGRSRSLVDGRGPAAARQPGSGSCWRCWRSRPAAWSPCRPWSTRCGVSRCRRIPATRCRCGCPSCAARWPPPAPSELVVTRPPGYLLDVDP